MRFCNQLNLQKSFLSSIFWSFINYHQHHQIIFRKKYIYISLDNIVTLEMNKDFSVNVLTLRPLVLTFIFNLKFKLRIWQLSKLLTLCVSNCSTYTYHIHYYCKYYWSRFSQCKHCQPSLFILIYVKDGKIKNSLTFET